MHQNLRAQIPTAGTYISNNTMSAFHGTWQWVSGADTVQIYLTTEKVYCDINGGFFWDLLVGWHKYIKGNTLIESSYPMINNVGSRTFTGTNQGASSPNKIEKGTLRDILKNKEIQLSLTLNSAQNQMVWKLEQSPGIKIQVNGQTEHKRGFTLPENIVLIKL